MRRHAVPIFMAGPLGGSQLFSITSIDVLAEAVNTFLFAGIFDGIYIEFTRFS
jgi:hypothetical protein